jgi:hypothetical protein
MYNKKIGKYSLLIGLILLILIPILISGLVFYNSTGNLRFDTGLLLLAGNILFYLGWFLLILGVLILKDFNRDWIYITVFLFLGFFFSRYNIIIGIIFLALSIFFALYLREEKDKHAIIVVIIDILLISYIIIVGLGYYYWIFFQ